MTALLTTAEVAEALSDPTSVHYLTPDERHLVGVFAGDPSLTGCGPAIADAVASVLRMRGDR